MANIYIAAAYWRSIKRGNRKWADIPEEMRGPVNVMAMQELADGIITAQQYAEWIGVPMAV